MFNPRTLLVALFVVVLSAGMTLAQDTAEPLPNDPAVNPDANACFAGGSMEGTCVTDSEWIAGWIKIRNEAGLIADEDVADGWEGIILGDQGYCYVEVDADDSQDDDANVSGFDVYDGPDGSFQYFTTDVFTLYEEC